MREIKFRAWDNQRQIMVSGERLFTQKNEGIIVTLFPIANILMQYTGLKDKNNKESYGKDIIKDNAGRIFIIRYSENKASFLFHYAKNQKQAIPFSSFIKVQLPFEIIGNELENPELLKEGKK